MKQFLTILTVVGAIGYATSSVSAGLPIDVVQLLPSNEVVAATSANMPDPTMMAQNCGYGQSYGRSYSGYRGGYGYGGYGYGGNRGYGYRGPSRSYYRGGSGLSISIGGGGRGGYPGRYGYGPGRSVYRGRGGGSGVGLFLSF